MRGSNALAVAALGAALVVAVAFGRSSTAAGTEARGADRPVRGNSSLEEARAIQGFDVYFAGQSVAGLPLTAVERRNDTAAYVSFVYGDCRAGDHQGCAPPLEIQTWPACVRHLSLYDDRDPFAPRPERSRVRGAPAGILDDGRQLELQTASSTVVMFAETRALVSRAAAALRGINSPEPAGDPLRPPVAGAVEGELACP